MNKKIVIILGMHRSGTSLLTAALESLGANLSIKSNYKSDENQKGFFENEEIVSFNDRLLEFLGGRWDNPLFDGMQALSSKSEVELEAWYDEADKIFKLNFSEHSFIAIKDPRMCQLLSFWSNVLKLNGFNEDNTFYVHVGRHPLEIAHSQRKRKQLKPEFHFLGESLMETVCLWMSLSYQSLRDLNSDHNIFLIYSEVLNNPKAQLERLAIFLGVECSGERVEEYCSSFVEQSLRRNLVDSSAEDELAREFPEAQLLYLNQKELAEKDSFSRSETVAMLNNWPPQSLLLQHFLSPIVPRFSELISQRLKMSFQISELDRRVGELQLDRDQARSEFDKTLQQQGKERDQIVVELKSQLGELKLDRDHTRSAFDQARSEFEKVLAQREKERGEIVANLESQLGELRLDRDQTRSELEKVLQQALEERAAIVSSLENKLAELEKDGSEKDGIILQLSDRVDQLQEQLVAMESSLQWHVTKPFRWMLNLVKDRRYSNVYNKLYRMRKNTGSLHLRLSVHYPSLSKAITLLFHPIATHLDRWLKSAMFKEIESRKETELNLLSEGRVVDSYQSIYQQAGESRSFRPYVSILVPNYNHAEFLRQRLDSIFSQTYQHFEVILLDDLSSDDSRQVLQEYHDRYPEKSRLIFNEKNSGGVFFQWQKGLAAVSGDLIWIAESDDWCSENFLNELVGYFNDEAVMMAYCRTVFMEGSTNKQIWSIEEYLHDIDANLWQSPFVHTANHIVNEAWAEKNIIPNVSSAIFRNPAQMKLLSQDDWNQMRICGDWMFYVHMIQGGLVAYTPNATNYYRIHSSNTSVATYSKDSYYQEHEQVSKSINKLYRVSESLFIKQKENIKLHWQQNRPSFSESDLDKCYSLTRIESAAKQHKPNLLMVGYAFAAGGGETFPIQMANLFKASGYSVTFLNCAQEPEEGGVRSMLRADIPVVNNFFALAQIVTDFDIDIIHSHHAWVDNTILDLLPEDSNCQTVVSLHGMYEMMSEDDLKRILPRMISRVGKFVFTAMKNLEAFEKMNLLNDDQFVNIGNALNIIPISPVNLSDLGIQPDAFVLCMVSRGIPDKGWKEAVETVKMARDISKRDIHLLLIGEGSEYDYYIKSGCPKYVHLLGFKKNIRDYFASSDMGYLPTRFRGESFPLVIIDCLHSGRPVLASDIGEIANMLEVEGEVAGCLFALENWSIPITKVAEIIARCATDELYYNQMMGAVSGAAEKFNPQIMRNDYDEIYMQLFSENRKGK